MAQGMTAHTAVPEPRAGFPPFQKDTFASQLIWLAVSFVVLYVVAAKIGLPRVASILAARRRHMEAVLAEADTYRTKTQQSLGEYEQTLGYARRDAEALVQDAQRQLAAEAKQTTHTLDIELKAQIAGAERSISAAQEGALANLRTIAIETSELVVASISGSSPAEGAAAYAVDRVLKRGADHAQ
jgi:F-type H+-transporting ATPase subunit b